METLLELSGYTIIKCGDAYMVKKEHREVEIFEDYNKALEFITELFLFEQEFDKIHSNAA